MAIHSSILAERIPWTEVDHGLVGHSLRSCEELDMAECLGTAH